MDTEVNLETMTELEYRKKKEEVRVMMKGGKSLYRMGIGMFVVGIIIAFAVYFGVVLMVAQTIEQLNAVTNLAIVIIIAAALLGGIAMGIGVYLKQKAKDMQIELDYWKETGGK